MDESRSCSGKTIMKFHRNSISFRSNNLLLKVCFCGSSRSGAERKERNCHYPVTQTLNALVHCIVCCPKRNQNHQPLGQWIGLNWIFKWKCHWIDSDRAENRSRKGQYCLCTERTRLKLDRRRGEVRREERPLIIHRCTSVRCWPGHILLVQPASQPSIELNFLAVSQGSVALACFLSVLLNCENTQDE